MRAVKLLNKIGLILVIALAFSLAAFAQADNPKTRERVANTDNKAETKTDTKTEENKSENPATDAAKTDDKNNMRREIMSEEEAAIIPYYNSYLKEYRLGPQDVISVEVFGQCPDYCKTGINVPPTAKISYPLVREGIFVGGKTVEQVAEEITKKLDEYIIDPKVTVTLEKVGSARFSVLGDVATPGVKLMERRVSVYEAIVEAGGVTRTGDRKRVTIVRQTPTGLTSIPVNLELIARGKSEMLYLVPGDQIIVPGNKIKMMDKVLDVLGKVSIVRLLFGSPF